MNNYIYYKQADHKLNFDKEEHVIPAALGGIAKLKKGTVSDEANIKFSKLELVALRNTFIGLNRRNNGPGKRGSLNVNKIKNPVIHVLKHEERNPVDFLLGFIFAGESYIIPQISIEYEIPKPTIAINYLSMQTSEESKTTLAVDLDKKLIQFLTDSKASWKFINSPYKTNKKFINIGCFHDKWYVTSSFNKISKNLLAVDILPSLMRNLHNASQKANETQPKILGKQLYKYEEEINLDSDTFYFMYLKTAFNALALFKGTDFVSSDIFDEVRLSIINLTHLEKYIETSSSLEVEITEYAKYIPDKAHYVIIQGKNGRITAYVSFYSEQPGILTLTDKYLGEDFIDGLICNWKERDEFRLQNLK